jgi:hypothetical protein
MASKSEDCSLQTMLQGAVAEETSRSTRMEILSPKHVNSIHYINNMYVKLIYTRNITFVLV